MSTIERLHECAAHYSHHPGSAPTGSLCDDARSYAAEDVGVVARIVTGPHDANRCAPDPGLTWDEIDEAGGVIRPLPTLSRGFTRLGRFLAPYATGATQPRGHDGQMKQGEQEVLHARDRVGQTSGATQRCLILESARELGIRDAQALPHIVRDVAAAFRGGRSRSRLGRQPRNFIN